MYKPTNKLQQKGTSFDNQKELRVGVDEDIQVQRMSGDISTDNRIDINDAEDNTDFRLSMPAGGPFMHPMHDATADPQLDNRGPGQNFDLMGGNLTDEAGKKNNNKRGEAIGTTNMEGRRCSR